MNIKKDQQLKPYNTFGIKASTKGLIRIYNENDIYETLVEELSPIRILGGGSNILMTGDFNGYILKNEIKGIDILDEDDDQVLVNVGAGEQWHNFVMWTIGHNFAGIENLALIPGSVGAAPMQNIGAYGVEQEACFHSLLAIDMTTGVKTTFFKKQCKFGYRESIFKHEFKDRYFIIQEKVSREHFQT
jgi:UDP-N-acetylmuramate dehydrogenase